MIIFSKTVAMALALIAIFNFPAQGQMINHNMAPPPAPRAQPAPPQPPAPLPPQLPPQLPQAPPSLPQMPFIPPMVPVIPQYIAQPTIAPAPDDFFKTNPEYLKLQDQFMTQSAIVRELQDELRRLQEQAHASEYLLNEAESNINKAKSALDYTKSKVVNDIEQLAVYIKNEDKVVNGNLISQFDIGEARKQIAIDYSNIAYSEQMIEFWTAEVIVRASKKDQSENELKQLQIELGVAKEKYEKISKERRAIEKQHAGEMRREEEALTKTSKEMVSAGDLSGDGFFDNTKVTKSSETADVAPIKSMQELREDSVREAFSEMGSLNFQTGFLEKVDMAGQVSQTVIGFIPGMSGTDVALSGVRGFAEALGDEMSKGTSWGDALSIAAVNAGIKGAVSIAGNSLTGGADKMINRVAVLTEVGFTKLTAKQVAEYGANGISFLVVKSGQVVGQAAVEEFAGKPALKKIADSIKSAKHVSGGGSSGGGYGMSTATQPLVAY
jgi:hypothetical protein